MSVGEIVTVDFHLDLPELYPAAFSFSPAIADGTLQDYRMCDWIDNALALEMAKSEQGTYGFMHLPCRVVVNPRRSGTNPAESAVSATPSHAMEKTLG
jgi:hypothetical protein